MKNLFTFKTVGIIGFQFLKKKNLLFSVLLLLACSKEVKTEKKYYETGELMSEKSYFSENDSTYYNIKKYYKTGNIHESISFKRGDKHGIQKVFNKKNKLKSKSLFIDGIHIIEEKYFESVDGKYGRVSCCEVLMDSLVEIGGYVYFLNSGEVFEEASFYYKVFGLDTVLYNELISCGVKFFNKQDDFKFRIEIGDLNGDMTFKNPENVEVLETQFDSLVYTFRPKKKGYNLLLGKVSLVKDTLKSEFPFYKEYYVH